VHLCPYAVVATRMAGKQLPKIGKMGTGLAMLKQHQRERSNQLTLHFLFILKTLTSREEEIQVLNFTNSIA